MNKLLLFGLFVNLQIVEFDTQDNLVKFECTQMQNLNLDTFEPLQKFGLRRYTDKKMWFKSTEPLKTIRLNNFNKKYKVKKISPYHFEIKCVNLQEYFDGTDNVEVIISK